MARLDGRVALISGAGTGIGRAIALAFAREGAKLALVGRRREPLEHVTAEIAALGHEALPIPCDVTKADEVAAAIRSTTIHFGRLDIVVNNAGVITPGTVETTSEEEFDRMLAVNVKGTFLMSRATLPELRKAGKGAIVNIGSFLGLVAIRNRAAYCAAKGAVTNLTRAMALDHAAENIRVNCICPGLVETEMARGALATYPDPAAELKRRIEGIPLGRIGQPEDVANLALFLASDESSWITGAAIPIEGGVTAQ